MLDAALPKPQCLWRAVRYHSNTCLLNKAEDPNGAVLMTPVFGAIRLWEVKVHELLFVGGNQIQSTGLGRPGAAPSDCDIEPGKRARALT